MKEVRDIKIDLLMGNQNPVIDLFCEITSGIKIINCNVYNEDGLEFIYHKDGQWIFYQDCKNEKFWTHYYKYWEFFESNFHLKYEEIQAITKVLVEEALKREVSPPKKTRRIRCLKVEEALKREVSPPNSRSLLNHNLVEDALKREVSTPTRLKFSSSEVEEALKREVSTPDPTKFQYYYQVEEALKREVSTPEYTFESYAAGYHTEVEEALKREVSTPRYRKKFPPIKVEEALKRFQGGRSE